MSFREVTALRKSGELDEALLMAREDYEYAIDNYSASALFWTLRLVCERSLRGGNNEEAIGFYNEMVAVYQEMDDDEGIGNRCLMSLEAKVSPAFSQIAAALADAKAGNAENAYNYISGIDSSSFPDKVKDNISWIFYYYLRSVVGVISIPEFEEITENYLGRCLPRPSMAHSQIMNLAVKFAGLHADYDLTEFIRRCGNGSFSDDDFTSDPEFAGGLSLVDRVIRRCFYNKSITLKQVSELFSEVVSESRIAELFSGSYVSILYKDSVELKDKKRFLSDASEYVSRIEGVTVNNKSHSRILESVIWELDKNSGVWFKDFFEKWGLGASFIEEDWKESVKDGNKLPSTAEKAITKYGEALNSRKEKARETKDILAAINKRQDATAKGANLQYEELLSQLKTMTERYKALLILGTDKLPESEVMPRRLARILLDEGKADEAIEIIKNLIKSRAGKYYFWDELADCFGYKGDDELCIACGSKALLTATDEKYVGRIHLEFGHALAKKGMYAEALHEIEVYRHTCEENGWSVRNGYQYVKNMIPEDTKATESNIALYHQYESIADAFVYSDLESHAMIMVEYKFEETTSGKKRLVYYLYDSNNDFIKVNPNAFGLDRKAKPMSCYEVKYLESDDKRRPVLIRPAENQPILSYKQAVVDNVNKEKGVFHAIGSGFDITVSLERIKFKVECGDVLDIAFKVKVKDGQRIAMFIHAKRSEQSCSLTTEFSGTIIIKENERGIFGFVGDVYVPRRLLNGIQDGDSVKGTGIMSDGKVKVLRIELS